MRVIAGTCRGRRLRTPSGSGTRPTADRVREAMFDVLGSLLAADGLAMDGLVVVDLFAGSGALGIEALSRGAARAVFVERDAHALAAIAANLAALGLGDRATVVRDEVMGWLAGPAQPADLALCDPPYDFDDWSGLLSRLDARLAVLESSRPVEVEPPWEVVKEKRYGGTLVTVVRCPDRFVPNGQKGSP